MSAGCGRNLTDFGADLINSFDEQLLFVLRNRADVSGSVHRSPFSRWIITQSLYMFASLDC